MRLADACPVRLISVDSALVYRGMDIGTAKPSPSELTRYPHQLIDVRDHWDTYTAADFAKDAKREIEQAIKAGETPILVGGTMLYFKALIEGLSPLPGADESFRKKLEERAAREGWPVLHAELARVDRKAAEAIHPNHSHRIERALELIHLTGEKPSELKNKRQGASELFDFHQYALVPNDRLVLHKRINARLLDMVEQGFVEEVQQLRSAALHRDDCPAMRAVGYRQCIDYLNGGVDRASFISSAQAATRQLCKRQLTWLRSWSELKTLPLSFNPSKPFESPQEIRQIVVLLLKFCEKSS